MPLFNIGDNTLSKIISVTHRTIIPLIKLKLNNYKSTEIANVLGISSRSVKNYVHEINGLYGNIITSSKNGYKANEKSANSLLALLDDNKIPQTNEERSFYIIKQLVLNHTSPCLDLFELCDFLCISYPIIKSVISKMNKTFSTYHVKFICKNDFIYIHGSEQNKRKLIGYVINEEAKNSYINTNLLKQDFPNIDIEQLQEIVLSTFKKYNYYLNDFALTNLILHLLIIVNREINGNKPDLDQPYVIINTIKEKEFLKDFTNQLESSFNIQLNEVEQLELYTLFKANANFYLATPSDDLKQIVGDEILSLTYKIISDVNRVYMIDLSTPNFITPFSLHLKNLIFRAKSRRYTNNPMTEIIRQNSPIIFDIAVYISLYLMNHYNIIIGEDEVVFIAMHIGAKTERQNLNKQKVPTVLVCPSYYDTASTLLNSLMLNFGNQIDIICSVSNELELKQITNEQSISIIFSTIPLANIYPDSSILLISPKNLESQFETIQTTILKQIKVYKDKNLKVNFHNFFEKDLFIANPNLCTKQQVITYLCDKLLTKNYVDDNFEKNVYKREAAATTAFGNIAIPHSVEMEAIKTSVAIAISKKGFQWGKNTVHIVLLLAINKAEQHTFRNLYESLISLFSEDIIIQEIRNCTSFNAFEKLICFEIDGKRPITRKP